MHVTHFNAFSGSPGVFGLDCDEKKMVVQVIKKSHLEASFSDLLGNMMMLPNNFLVVYQIEFKV